MLGDVHSPDHARVVLPLANFDQFAKAFNCPVDSRMNPKDKCIVWWMFYHVKYIQSLEIKWLIKIYLKFH